MHNLTEQIHTAASQGNIADIQALINSQPNNDARNDVLYKASKTLAAEKKIDELHTLIMQTPNVRLNDRLQAFLDAFEELVNQGYLDEMRLLATKPMPDKTDIKRILNLDNFKLFKTAANNENLEMMTELHQYITIARHHEYKVYHDPFCTAAKKGNEAVIKTIIELAQNVLVVSDMCKLYGYQALLCAVANMSNKNDDFLKLFLTYLSDQRAEEFKKLLKGPELERITRLLAEIKTAAQAPASPSMFRSDPKAAAADDSVSQDPSPK